MIDENNMTQPLTDFLPRHVAIILDGNGRWAKSRGLPRLSGHYRGADAVRRTVTHCRKRGIKVLSLFAFSSQNWSRPSSEVSGLMSLLSNYLETERSTIMSNGIRLTSIGDLDLLPKTVHRSLRQLISDSSSNNDMILCLCLSYGGREEIVSMAKEVAKRALAGTLVPDDLDVAKVDELLWSHELGPVDLLIRTSGELRVSNFLLWSLAYAELHFVDCMWPDFDSDALDTAFSAYSLRHRRFGRIP
jgi:undecaprenyl diphosphate synthase